MTENAYTEIAVIDENAAVVDLISDLNDNTNKVFSTIVAQDFDSRKKVFNAITAAEPLADHLNKTINLAHVIGENIKINDTDDKTGEILGTTMAPLIILIDDKGKAYRAVSAGLAQGVKRLFQIVGKPENWDGETVPVKVEQVSLPGGKRVFNLKLA